MVTLLLTILGFLVLLRVTRGPRHRALKRYDDECRAWQEQENERREWLRNLRNKRR